MTSLSSSSSFLEDSTASSILGASGWNRQKEALPVRGQPTLGGIGRDAGDDTAGDETHRHLLKKRIYPAFQVDSTTLIANSDEHEDAVEELTELEEAVLLDCLSTNFLFSHLSKEELQLRVLQVMEKVSFRTHEVIVKQGDPADFVYVLYQGQVEGASSNEEPNKLEDAPSSEEEKYTVFGELGLLTKYFTPKRTRVRTL
jgi:hypothetical protein